MSLVDFYCIHNRDNLFRYTRIYWQLVSFYLDKYQINDSFDFRGDHLGLQVLSVEEFDQCHEIFLEYSSLINKDIIHQRRNNIYKFNMPLKLDNISIPKIEIFEPKPDANLGKLRPGIEHISLKVNNYQKLLQVSRDKGVPIDKAKEINGSRFFKTQFINGVEIEFRNDGLGE